VTIDSEVSQADRRPPSRLRRARLEQGLTVEDLASRAGISGRTILSAELGEHHPYPASRRVIAMALGLAERTLWPPDDSEEAA
jgi:transcriptional regulator with XRE-family HTH domain